VKITRKELYDAIWQLPKNKLSIKWGLPSIEITETCKEYNIPLPPSGYWTKAALGTKINKVTLTGDPDVAVELKLFTLKSLISPDCTTHSDKQTAHPPKNKVLLTISIEKALPPVRKAFKSYSSPSAKRAYRYQYVWPSGETLLGSNA
jgi:hypothetical protein